MDAEEVARAVASSDAFVHIRKANFAAALKSLEVARRPSVTYSENPAVMQEEAIEKIKLGVYDALMQLRGGAFNWQED